MEPRILSRPAFTVAGLVHRGTVDGEKIGALWGRYFQRMGEVQQVVEPNVAYGVMANYDEASGEFDYIAACQVASREDLPAGFRRAARACSRLGSLYDDDGRDAADVPLHLQHVAATVGLPTRAGSGVRAVRRDVRPGEPRFPD